MLLLYLLGYRAAVVSGIFNIKIPAPLECTSLLNPDTVIAIFGTWRYNSLTFEYLCIYGTQGH